LDDRRRVEFGQVFTPAPVAEFLASMFDIRPDRNRVLDPGAGVGQLAAAFAERWVAASSGDLDVTAVERDISLHEPLAQTLASIPGVSRLVSADYIEWATPSLLGDISEFDYIILNPPYAKLNTGSAHRRLVASTGVDVTNLYAAFVTLAVRQLSPGGQLVAITPRSFTNGPYFRSFRRDLLDIAGLRRIHVYDTRNTAFADSAVLQENVVFHVERGLRRSMVKITSSAHPGATDVRVRDVPFTEVVRPDDGDAFIHLSPDEAGADAAASVLAQPDTLKSLGVQVSTGRVVDFRSRDQLRTDIEPGCVPLLYPGHLKRGKVHWPVVGKKPNALMVDDDTRKMLLPAGHYVLIKRFSSKEERRRIVATLLSPSDLPSEFVAVENHLNVIHSDGAGLDRDLAAGLCMWLSSTVVDDAFRQFSGHTQVNATDLRSMRFPPADHLRALGAFVVDPLDDQVKCDELVTEHVLSVTYA
jgi:adenine-specific DNA-methyltransferase